MGLWFAPLDTRCGMEQVFEVTRTQTGHLITRQVRSFGMTFVEIH
jgi:hypothetical protein